MHHLSKWHSMVPYVHVRREIACYSWNINSAPSCNCDDAEHCTHIVPLLCFSLESRCFLSHSTLVLSPIYLYFYEIQNRTFTHAHCKPDWTYLESLPESSSRQPIRMKTHQFIHHFRCRSLSLIYWFHLYSLNGFFSHKQSICKTTKITIQICITLSHKQKIQ